ncbi:hypothetical protein ZWY2020_007536 [Hordeum vulgare]|nr:hypothetical protein ZWY2020_007536 [Hordeum vulgare]
METNPLVGHGASSCPLPPVAVYVAPLLPRFILLAALGIYVLGFSGSSSSSSGQWWSIRRGQQQGDAGSCSRDRLRRLLCCFKRSDHNRFSSPDRNEQEIGIVAKELATCKLQLDAKESVNKQANMKLEALRKTMQDLSEKYDQACLDAHRRITELEADNVAITTRQSQAAAECEALRDELDVAVGELDAVRRANAYVLGEVESMETRRILERESARDGLMRVLELNEAVLDSAVAAIKAEEERSVYFQEVTLQMFSSDKNLEAIRKHKEAMEGMEGELLAKTVEVECLRSELLQLKELYVSSSERVMVPASATVQHADGEAVANPADAVLSCDDDHVDVNAGKSDNGKGSQEPGGEVADLVNGCPEVAEAYFDSELPREECRNIQSGDGNTNVATSADAVEVRAGQRRRVRFMPESPMEDFKSVNSECCKFMDAGIGMSGSQAATRGSEPEAAGAGFVSEIVEVNSKEADGDGELYTKDQVVDVDRLGDGYVLVAKKADGGALKDEARRGAGGDQRPEVQPGGGGEAGRAGGGGQGGAGEGAAGGDPDEAAHAAATRAGGGRTPEARGEHPGRAFLAAADAVPGTSRREERRRQAACIAGLPDPGEGAEHEVQVKRARVLSRVGCHKFRLRGIAMSERWM